MNIGVYHTPFPDRPKDQTVPASCGRKLLAWFIDAWIALAIVPPVLDQFGIGHGRYAVFLVFCFLALRFIFERALTTPGLLITAIDIHDRIPMHITVREDSASLGLGIIAFLAGSQLMGVSLGHPAPIPLFGLVFPEPLYAIALFSTSVLLMCAGYLTARISIAGWWMVTALLALWILSVLTGWEAWQELVVNLLALKRQEFGLGLRPGEAEILPILAKTILVLPPSFVILLLMGTYGQFKHSGDNRLTNKPKQAKESEG